MLWNSMIYYTIHALAYRACGRNVFRSCSQRVASVLGTCCARARNTPEARAENRVCVEGVICVRGARTP